MQPTRNEFGNCQLARIDHIAPLLQLVIEGWEYELGICWHMKRDNDRCLQICRKKRFKSKFCHALDKYPAIVRIAAIASEETAFKPKFLDRLPECCNCVRWRRKAPLTISFEALILIMQIKN